jgi:hypothetical protein
MATAQATQLSDFFYKLEPNMKARYLEKISQIRGDDPYSMSNSDFYQDVELLPSLR